MVTTAVGHALWNDVLVELECEVGPKAVDLWLRDAALVDADREEVVVAVPTALAREKLASPRIADALARSFARLIGGAPRVRVVVEPALGGPPEDPAAAPGEPAPKPARPRPAPRPPDDLMSFRDLVGGPGNREAIEAAERVCRAPGVELNPLVFCGAEGIGKTHLLTAIARRLREGGATKVVHTTAEDFTNHFTAGIRARDTARFRERYREADALLIDDIHLLRSKPKTQLELLHTLEALLHARRQVVVTSDASPKRLVDLHPGLVGRLLAGLVVTVEPPDLETRRRIAEGRARRLGVPLERDVIEYIAFNVTRSIRDLCGAITMLQAHAAIGERVDVSLAKRRLGALVSPEPPLAPEARIVSIVAEELSIPRDAILGTGRRPDVARARQVAMYLARRLTRLSLREIGAFFDRRASTVTSAECRIESLLAGNAGLRKVIEDATKRFHATPR